MRPGQNGFHCAAGAVFIAAALLSGCASDNGPGLPAAFAMDPIVIEAESTVLTGIATIEEGCSKASGGAYVKLGPGNWASLEAQNIVVPSAGKYVLRVMYYSSPTAPPTNTRLIINGRDIGILRYPPGGWCFNSASRAGEIRLSLQKGANTIKLAMTSDPAPLIDTLKVSVD